MISSTVAASGLPMEMRAGVAMRPVATTDWVSGALAAVTTSTSRPLGHSASAATAPATVSATISVPAFTRL